jgi:hypothetical protein
VEPRAGLDDVEKILDSTGTRTPTFRPARSQSLYRSKCTSPRKYWNRPSLQQMLTVAMLHTQPYISQIAISVCPNATATGVRAQLLQRLKG